MSAPVILGAVCARGGSKGVPRKNLRILAGKPLIAHTIACARACSRLDVVVVSTDDEEIARTAASCGACVPFLRPAELARDDSGKWGVFQHLVTAWEHLDGRRVAAIVDLDTGVPLRQPADVTACVDLLFASDADVVATAYEPERNPYFNMVERTDGGAVQLVKTLDRPIVRRQDAPDVFSVSPAVFAIRRDALWQVSHWSQSRMRVHVVPRERAIDIDTEFDLQLVEFLMGAGSHLTMNVFRA